MVVQNNKSRITNQRNLKRANKIIADDFEEMIQEEIEDGTAPKPKNSIGKYKEILAPLVLATFATAMNAQSNIEYQQKVYTLAEEQLNIYTDKLETILNNGLERVKELDIDKSTYNELESKGASILEKISIADKSNISGYQKLSPELLEISLNNSRRQMESLSDYTYNSNLLDYNGERLNTHKEWVWSELEDTRHSNMDHTIIPIDDLFEVYNEQTDEIGYGLFPCDAENLDVGNLMNCQCSINYLSINSI